MLTIICFETKYTSCDLRIYGLINSLLCWIGCSKWVFVEANSLIIYIDSFFKLNLMGKRTANAADIVISYSSISGFDLVADINTDLDSQRHWFADRNKRISPRCVSLFPSLSSTCSGFHFP